MMTVQLYSVKSASRNRVKGAVISFFMLITLAASAHAGWFEAKPFDKAKPFALDKFGSFDRAEQFKADQAEPDNFKRDTLKGEPFKSEQFHSVESFQGGEFGWSDWSAAPSDDFSSLNAVSWWQQFEPSFSDKAEADKHSVYYTEYADSEGTITGKRYALTRDKKELVVYSSNQNVKADVEPNQVVRILAKAEAGETLWVLIGTGYHPGTAYAKSYAYGYGPVERLQAFDPYASYAYRMYYVKNCDDNLLDLGYGDYSKLAGYNGSVTITVKKGEDPKELKTIQTINLSYKQ